MNPGRWAKYGNPDPPLSAGLEEEDPPLGETPLQRALRRLGPPKRTEMARDATDIRQTEPAVRPFVDRSAELGLLPLPAPTVGPRPERPMTAAADVTAATNPGLRRLEATQNAPQPTIGTNPGGEVGSVGDLQEGRRQGAIVREWESKPAPVRHAVAGSEGFVRGVTAGHPEILLDDEKLAAFEDLPLTTGEQITRTLGFAGGAAGAIGTQNAAVGGAARFLPATGSARAAVEALRPGAQTGARSLGREALQSVPYDLALPAEDLGERLQNVGIGATGAVIANRLPRRAGTAAEVEDQLQDASERVSRSTRPAVNEELTAKLREISARSARPGGAQGAGSTPRLLGAASGTQGAASRDVVGTVGGVAAGATAGAAIGGEDNRAAGAATGALLGGRAGLLAARLGRKSGARPQLAHTDPDVQTILSTSATPQKAMGVGGKLSSALRGVPGAVRNTYQSLLDDVYSARRFGRMVGDTEEVSIEASRSRGWRGWADELVGIRPRGTGSTASDPTLREAVEAARGIEDDVVAYTRAQRALELAKNGMPEKGVDLAAAEAAVQKLGQVPEVTAAADKLRGFYRHLLDLRHRNGLLDDEGYQAILESGEHYVPFLRDLGEETAGGAGGAGGGKLFNRSSGVRRMKAGKADSPIVDPFEQAVLDAQSTAREVSRQRVFNVVSRIVEQDPNAAADWIRPIAPKFLGKKEDGGAMLAAPFGKEGRVIQTVVDGKRKYYEVVDEDLYDSLASLSPDTQSLFQRLVNVFSLPAQGLRTGVTNMPAFGAANAQRDAFFTSLAYKFPTKQTAAGSAVGGAVGAATAEDDERLEGLLTGAGFGAGAGVMAPHAKRIAGGLRHIIGNDDVYQSFLREGGAGTGFFVPNLKTARDVVGAMRQEGISARDIYHPASWWDALQKLNRSIEEAPRVAKFKDALQGGADPAAAAVAGREVSLDFARGGSGTKELRKLRAFWNPMIQGMDKLRSVLNPVKNPNAYMVGLAGMTAPSIALWNVNKDDPTYWQQPLWIRNLNWMVPVGTHEDGSTKFLYIPKPFEVGYAFGSVPERALDYLYQRDPERAKEAVRQMLGQTFGDLAPVPTAAEPLLENKFNYDTFRQRPVVGYDMQDLPTREQYNNETSSLALGASRAAELATFGLVQPSPEKIDHVLEGYTGSLGRTASEGISKMARVAGLDSRPAPPDRTRSQWARFVSRPGGFSSDDVDTMFRRFERADAHRAQYERLLDAGEDAAAERYAAEHEEDLEMAGELKGYVSDFRKLARERREIERDPVLSAEEKERMVGNLGQEARRVAALAVGPTPAPMFRDPIGKTPTFAADSLLQPKVPGTQGEQEQGNLGTSGSKPGGRWSKYRR